MHFSSATNQELPKMMVGSNVMDINSVVGCIRTNARKNNTIYNNNDFHENKLKEQLFKHTLRNQWRRRSNLHFLAFSNINQIRFVEVEAIRI